MIEQALAKTTNQVKEEKTFVDKVLGREDSDRLRRLMRKDVLTREDLLEVLYLLSGTEIKLVNFDAFERYLVTKFFVWVREFAKVQEIFFDTQERYEKEGLLDAETKKLLDSTQAQLSHNIKFMVDLYLNITRSSLSINASAFKELLSNKFEFAYPLQNNPELGQKKTGLMASLRGN